MSRLRPRCVWRQATAQALGVSASREIPPPETQSPRSEDIFSINYTSITALSRLLRAPVSMADPLSSMPNGTYPLRFAPSGANALAGKRARIDDVVAFRCESPLLLLVMGE